MNTDIIIGNIIKILSIPKIIFYRIFFSIKIPFGSIISGFPKIRCGKNIKIKKGFKIGRFCRLNGSVKIGKNFFMNEFGTISAGCKGNGNIIIGNDVMIGPFFYCISGDHGFNKNEKFNITNNGKYGDIKIGNNVWIGAKVIILKGVEIGDNVVIGAGSIVTKNIESDSLAVGNPAKVIKKL